jgi:hypothetical protein
MRKGRKKPATATAAREASQRRRANLSEATYFRLCHLCLHLNESSTEIARCGRCRHSLTSDPLLHYLEQIADGGDDAEMELPPDEEFHAPREDGEGITVTSEGPPPLAGLSVRW